MTIHPLNVRNDKALIQAIRRFWIEKGHNTDYNFNVNSITNNNIQVIGITNEKTMSYYSSRISDDYTNIYSLVEFMSWYHKNISNTKKNISNTKKNISNTKFVVGDKVTITMNSYSGTGTIIKDVSDVCPDQHPNYLVELDKRIYINPLLTISHMVINEVYFESEPVYIDEVMFIYDGNETKKLSVIKEDDKYIEGHKFGTKEYRKYLKSKIVGNIYRKK